MSLLALMGNLFLLLICIYIFVCLVHLKLVIFKKKQYKRTVYATANHSDAVYRFDRMSNQWTQLPGQLVSISVHSASDVVGVNAAGQVYQLDPAMQQWHHLQMLSAPVAKVSFGADGIHVVNRDASILFVPKVQQPSAAAAAAAAGQAVGGMIGGMLGAMSALSGALGGGMQPQPQQQQQFQFQSQPPMQQSPVQQGVMVQQGVQQGMPGFGAAVSMGGSGVSVTTAHIGGTGPCQKCQHNGQAQGGMGAFHPVPPVRYRFHFKRLFV